MKNHFKDISVKKDYPLLDALEIMDKGAFGILFVVDEEGRLIGIFNDIDLRIAILDGKPMNLTIEHYMNRNPITIPEYASEEEMVAVKEKYATKRIIPVLDADGRVVRIEKTRMATPIYANPVVILAGGSGSRLMPLTASTPKPMLNINGKPLLEITLQSLQAGGFRKIYMSINYCGNKIREHFGDGSRFGVDIQYLEEPVQLGTAGPIALLKDCAGPCLVINGDILTKVNFAKVLDYHLNSENKFTAALYQYDFQVPFGVADIRDGKFTGVDEKPVRKFFILAGIYVVDSDIISLIPKGRKYDMTELIDEMVEKDMPVGCFPLREYWIDIGRQSEYQKAKEDFSEIFAE